MTYIDIATTCALYGFDPRQQISRHIAIDFYEDFPVNSSILMIEAKINRLDNEMAFIRAKFTIQESCDAICTGTHMKTFRTETLNLAQIKEM